MGKERQEGRTTIEGDGDKKKLGKGWVRLGKGWGGWGRDGEVGEGKGW